MGNDTKRQIMTEIELKGEQFAKKSNVQYVIRCPFCGDSQKKLTDAHCYIKCDYNNPDEEIKYNCFLCNRGGYVGVKFLKALNVNPQVIDLVRGKRHNTIGSMREASIDIIAGEPVMNSPQIKFLTQRLGEGFTVDDYRRFRIIWNMGEVRKFLYDEKLLNTLPNNLSRINFISDNKSMLLSRSFIEDSNESQWRKIQLFNTGSRSFYMIQSTLDLFTSDVITVNIAEGILDILSAYKNFNAGPNSVYIASLGSSYLSALDYMIAKGFIGKNIDVRIYIDHGIDENSLCRKLKEYKWLFKSIKVFKNIKYKDIGVRVENILLKEVMK